MQKLASRRRSFGSQLRHHPTSDPTTRTSTSCTVGIMRLQFRSLTNEAGNGSSSTRTSAFQLPDPTWSIRDLELSKQHAPISDTELQTLAKRALLDLTHLENNNDNSNIDGDNAMKMRQQLRQDLGNMMHMIEQVRSFDFDNQDDTATTGGNGFAETDLYDKPRGVVAAPLRRDPGSEDNGVGEQIGNNALLEEQEAKRVFENFLQPQTTKVGAHNYFSIETKNPGN